jgi:hypothetical protein
MINETPSSPSPKPHGPRPTAFEPGDNSPKFFVGIVRTGLVICVRYNLVS